MTDETIPQNVKAFIADSIDSVGQVEILLLISRDAEKFFTAEEVGRALGIRPEWAEADLKLLSERGLLTISPEGTVPRVYRYAPRSPELEANFKALVAAYQQRRVTIINLIIAKPTDRLRDFADAFRLRKDRPPRNE